MYHKSRNRRFFVFAKLQTSRKIFAVLFQYMFIIYVVSLEQISAILLVCSLFYIFCTLKKCSTKVIQKCSCHIRTPKRTIKKYNEVRNRPIILTLHEITIERGLGKSSRDPSLSSCYYISCVYYFLCAVAVLLYIFYLCCVL